MGWSDVYRNFLPGQYLIITGVANGDYCLVSTADPVRRLSESNEGNNSASVRLRLSGSSVAQVSGPCIDSTAPPTSPPPSGSAYVYDDSLRWNNWSWQTSVNTTATSPVYAGSRSLAATYTGAWAGLALQSSGFNTSGYNRLRFAIRPGGSLPDITVALHDSGGTRLRVMNMASP